LYYISPGINYKTAAQNAIISIKFFNDFEIGLVFEEWSENWKTLFNHSRKII